MKTCLTYLLLLIWSQIWGQNQAVKLNSEDDQIGFYDYLLNNPLDLNRCSQEELNQIHFLSSEQINSFLSYREKYGQLIHIFELQVIEHWDIGTCRNISQFVFISSKASKDIRISNSLFLLRLEETLEKAIGFEQNGKASSYQGNRLKEFIKFKNTSNPRIKFGFLSQKDAGEKNPLDFYSLFVEINPTKLLQKVIIGDYSVQWGQGLLQTGGFNLGKNYESIKSTQKFHIGGLPYSSSAEYSFNRGIYIHKILSKGINWQSFISNKYLDGKIYETPNQRGFRTIDSDGYHRNSSEIANQKTIHEFKWGNSIEILLSNEHRLQLNSIHTAYQLPKIPSGIDYKNNEWAGSKYTLWSISHTGNFHNLRMNNEYALINLNSYALIHGAAFSFSKKQDVSYLIRYYKSGFYNPDGKAFGENTKNENEFGLFLGHQFQFSKRKKVSSYLDLFYFPEIKYQVSSPNTFGWEILTRYQMERKNAFKFFFQTKWTSKQEDYIIGKNEKKIQRIHDFQESLDFTTITKNSFQAHSRLMLHALQKNKNFYLGFMLLQDIDLNGRKISFNGRFSYFKTPNYDTRLYAFEPGLPFSFNLIAYSGEAIRLASTLEITVNKYVRISTKIGRTFYFDRNEIGSGTDMIQSNHKTDFSLQFMYKNL